MENEIETEAPPPVSSLRSRWEAMSKRTDNPDDSKAVKSNVFGSKGSRSHKPEDRPVTPTVVVSPVASSNAYSAPLRRVVSTPTSPPSTPSPSEPCFPAPRLTRTSPWNSRDASRAEGSSTEEEEDNNPTPSPATPRKTPSTPSFNLGSGDHKGLGIGLGTVPGGFSIGRRNFSGSSAGPSDGATSPRNSIVAQLVENGLTDAENLSRKLTRKPPPPPPGKKPAPPVPPTRNGEGTTSHSSSRSVTPSADSDDSRHKTVSTSRNHLRTESSASNLSINLAPPGPPPLPARGTPSPTLPPRSPAPMKSPTLPPRSTEGPAMANTIMYPQGRGFRTPPTEHISPAGSDGSESAKPSLVPPKLPSRGGNGSNPASPAAMNGPPLPRRSQQASGISLDPSSSAPRLPPRSSPMSAPSSPDENADNPVLETPAAGRRVPPPPLSARGSLTPTGEAQSHPPPPPQRTPSGDSFLPPPARVVPPAHDAPNGANSLKDHHHRHHYPHLPHQLNSLPITKILAAVKLGGHHSGGSKSPHGPGSPSTEYAPPTNNVELSGTAGLPPPPVRNVIDKIASLRPHSSAGRNNEDDATSSDDEEGDNSAPGNGTGAGGSGIKRHVAKAAEELPDSSRSNRRPPILPEFQHPPSVYAAHHRVANRGDGIRETEIHVPAHAGVVAVAGWWVVVASSGIITVTNMNVAEREKGGGGGDVVDDWESEGELEMPKAIKGVWSIEMKGMNIEWKVDKPRVTAMEFRHGSPSSVGWSSRNPSNSSLRSSRTAVNRPSTSERHVPPQSDDGRYLWCGTRDGCLFELDIWNGGKLTDVRVGAHTGHITGIFRLPGHRMITIDEHGKTLVFCGVGIERGCDDGSQGVKSGDGYGGWLSRANPRVHRIQHREGFVRVLNGRLWTSPAPGLSNGNNASASGSAESMLGAGGSLASIAQAASNAHRIREHYHQHHHHHRTTSHAGPGPVVRIHEIDEDGALVTKSVAPGHNIGAVMCGTVLPSMPGLVYLGHEGGWVTVWKWQDSIDEMISNSSLMAPLQHHGSLSSLNSPSATSSCSDEDDETRVDHSPRSSMRGEKGRRNMIVGDTSGPVCIRKVKISISDVMSLEGVASRLWAGTRKGVVHAYDVTGRIEHEIGSLDKEMGTADMEQRPWTVTNVWKAHGELPVTRIVVDPFSIQQTHKLVAYSVGRDEVLRFWDGFLSQNWIDSEMLNREALYCTFRPLKMLICTWNIDAAKPDALLGTNNVTFLKTFLLNPALEGSLPDMIVFGFQEVIDLEDKKLTAKAVLLGTGKKRADGGISEKVSRHYRMWHDRLISEVQRAYPAESYIVQHTENLVGLFTCVFVRRTLAHPTPSTKAIRDISITTVKRGMHGTYGNKGAIVARFIVDDSSFCFLNCHLAAGQSQKVARNMDLASILEEKAVFPISSTENIVTGDFVAYVGGGDGTMILDHELCFLNGDLNYRIEQRRDAVISNVQAGKLVHLLQYDQLLHEMRSNPTFRLQVFTEPPITFSPTYKYDRKSNNYDSSEKKRIPAWCDRILYRSRDASRIQNLWYGRYEPDISDHRPVCGAYRVVVKKVIPEKHAHELSMVRKLWDKEQLRICAEMRAFYEGQ